MIDALRAAGFPGVEADGGVVHARLWSSSVEFTVVPENGAWRFALAWPVRATEDQRAGWNLAHPDAPMDIHLGETRISMRIADPGRDRLLHWAAVAEEAVAECIRWRRAQRAPGEGM